MLHFKFELAIRYQVTGKETQSIMIAQADQRGGHFATYLIPAVDYQTDKIVPKDVVFLMDTSGSQRGAAIAQSKELMRQFIQGLHPQDTFTIMDFSNTTQKLSSEPLANTEKNREKALKYVEKISANGGTELMNGINEVLSFPEMADGRLRTIVLLTDGLIGDDRTIIGMMEDQLKPGNRIFTFGVGYGTNHFLINRLAEVGRGTSEILPEQEDPKAVVAEFFEEINNPVLTNVEVSWVGAGDAPEIYPEHMPDLFAAQPLVIHGKKGDRQNGQLKITGMMAGGKRYEKIFAVNFDQVQGNGAIAQLWGRAKIKEYMNDMYWYETTEGKNIVTNTALDYRLVSDYTSFVAVSDEVRVNPQAQTLVEEVPLATPDGLVDELKTESAIAPQTATPTAPQAVADTASTEAQAMRQNQPISPPPSGTNEMAAESTTTSQPAATETFAPNAAPMAKNVAPTQPTPTNGNSKDVPEPSQIIGNLLVLLGMGFFFWKRSQARKVNNNNSQSL